MPFTDEPPAGAVAASAHGAGRRVALVIGNAKYFPQAPDLRNPINDARLIADRLAIAGFGDITRIDDAEYQVLRRAVRTFAEKAEAAEMAVVYFAGHGIEVDGQNHLIPIGAELKHERDIAYETLSLAELTKALEGASKLRLIMLDACRDSPFPKGMKRSATSRSIGRGLAELEPYGNVLIAYAAKAGTTASDGQTDNSPFAEALAEYLVKPGLEIGFVFRHVRDAVLKATDPKQEPWLYGSLSADPIYLVPPPAAPAVIALPVPPAAANSDEHDIFISYANADRATAADMAQRLEGDGYRVWWDTQLIGGQSFRKEIEQRLDSARAVIVIWTSNSISSASVEAEASRAREANKLIPTRIPALETKAIPMPFNSLHTIEAGDVAGIKAGLGRLGVAPRSAAGTATPQSEPDMKLWAAIKDSDNPADFEDFIGRFPDSVLMRTAARRFNAIIFDCRDKAELEFLLSEFPDSPRRPLVEAQLAQIEWAEVRGSESAEKIRAFLARHPKARDTGDARAVLAALLWRDLESTDDVQAVTRFADEFSDLPQARDAHARIAKIQSARAEAEAQRRETEELIRRHDTDWATAQREDTIGAYDRFLAAWRGGPHNEAARKKLDVLNEQVRVAAERAREEAAERAREEAAEAARRAQEDEDRRSGGVPVFIGNGKNDRIFKLKPGQTAPRDIDIAPEMVLVPPGDYLQGDETAKVDGINRRKVTIGYPLLVGKYPVTFAEWDAYVAMAATGGLSGPGGSNPHKPSDPVWKRGRRPVIDVSWQDAKGYVDWLSKVTGKSYRLLTEAEWEYCCRAGTKTAFSFGDTITKAEAQYSEDAFGSAGTIVDVGTFPSNAFGLHDMHGNVWEWCEDAWAESYLGVPDDGSARTSTDQLVFRVLRGGSWCFNAKSLRSANRSKENPLFRNGNDSFRLARTLSPSP